jgi:HSP20 family molecular chaperone IbpA
MMNRLSSMIDQSVARSLDNYFSDKMFQIQVSDKGKYYQAVTNIEGIDPNDIKVSFANGLLTVSGEKRIDSVSPDGTERTSRYEYVSKTVSVPDTDKGVTAQAVNNRLMVRIPKE